MPSKFVPDYFIGELVADFLSQNKEGLSKEELRSKVENCADDCSFELGPVEGKVFRYLKPELALARQLLKKGLAGFKMKYIRSGLITARIS